MRINSATVIVYLFQNEKQTVRKNKIKKKRQSIGIFWGEIYNSLFLASILAFLFLYHYVRLRHRVFKKFISLGLDSLGLHGDNQFEIEELYSRLSLMERRCSAPVDDRSQSLASCSCHVNRLPGTKATRKFVPLVQCHGHATCVASTPTKVN